MSGSHEKLPKLFWVQIVLVVIVGVLYLLAPEATQHVAEASSEVKPVVKKAQQTLAPIGNVEAKADEIAGSAVARSGESIYKETCGTCHNTGIANAPKIDDKAAWETRMTNGIDGLVKTALAGKGAMPAKGGNPTITDEEIKETIIYMIKSAGIEASTGTETKEEAATASSDDTGTAPITDTETTTTPVAQDATTIVKEPETPTAPTAPAAPEPTTAPEVSTEAPEAPAVADTEALKAPEQDASKKEAPKAPEPMAVAQTKEAPKADLAKGEKVYNSSCFACHASGVAGSPKLGDIAAWEPRLAAGSEAMYASAINGKGVMPPKGGNLGLSDEDVKAAVDYMSANSQ